MPQKGIAIEAHCESRVVASKVAWKQDLFRKKSAGMLNNALVSSNRPAHILFCDCEAWVAGANADKIDIGAWGSCGSCGIRIRSGHAKKRLVDVVSCLFG